MIINKMTYFNEKLYVLNEDKIVRVYNTNPLEYEYNILFDGTHDFIWGFYGHQPMVILMEYDNFMTTVKMFDLRTHAISREFCVNEMMTACTIIDEHTCLCVNVHLNIFIFDDRNQSLTLVNNPFKTRQKWYSFSVPVYQYVNQEDADELQRYFVRWIDPIPNTHRYIFRSELCSYIFDLQTKDLIDIREYRTLYAPVLLATEKYLFALEHTYDVHAKFKLQGVRITRYDLISKSWVIVKKVDTSNFFVCDNHLLIPFPKDRYFDKYELAIYDVDSLDLITSFASDELYRIENTVYWGT